MGEFLDITPGSVSVMGLMDDTEHRVKLLIDEDEHESPGGQHICGGWNIYILPQMDYDRVETEYGKIGFVSRSERRIKRCLK